LAGFDALRPAALPIARGVVTLGGTPPAVRIPDDPMADALDPGFLSAVDAAAPATPDGGGKRRAALSRWLTSKQNPLTARVIVNRLWQHHFGRGLVATSEDFGVQGMPPSHPKLLDWLASTLVARDWSLKTLHRMIVTSQTYRQDTRGHKPQRARVVDPDNRLWWRRDARRLEAEVLRDSMLATSGELNTRMYGASVYPELPEDYITSYRWEATAQRSERNRRSCYLAVRRNAHLPLLKTFDVPDTFGPCARRVETTTPAQALVLLNSRWTLEEAQRFAARLLREVERPRRGAWIGRAFELTFGRRPAPGELAASLRFLSQEEEILAARIEAGETVALPTAIPAGVEKNIAAALVDFCHSLWNTNEFLYYD